MVSKMTGLSTHTLRMWEKRYIAVLPKRTEAGGRLYTDADVERLRLLHELVQQGHSIGGIAKLSDSDLRHMAASFSAAPSQPAAQHLPELRSRVIKSIEQLRIGGIEIGNFNLGPLGPIVPEANVVSLPFIFKDVDHMWRVLDGKAGDIIIAVDGEDTSGESLNDVVDKIRGPKGEPVTLTVLRVDGDETQSLDITIIRDEIDIPAASWAMIPGTNVALLRLSQFNGNALRDLTKSVEEAKAAGATQLVLDLRNNPGGLLDQAVKVTSQFLKDGNVLQEEDADGNIKLYPVEPGGVATDIPMAVLINPGTASSAEIMAGAIQDYDRAPLVGETTFGTGTVLEPFTLEDGSALLLGTRQWLTAKGRLIRKQGIEPDVEVDLPISADLIGPEALEEMTVDDLLNSEDAQLLKALELLDVSPQ